MKRLMMCVAVTVALSVAAWSQQRGGRFGPIALLMQPEVQVELKLTDEQKTKIQAIGEAAQSEARELFQELQNASQEERQKKFGEFQASVLKRINDVLTPEQAARFKQLSLRSEGLAAVGRKDVADELKITDEQREKIGAVVREMQAARREAFQSLGQGASREEIQKKMQEIRTQTEEKILPILTEEQKKKWTEMLGPEPKK